MARTSSIVEAALGAVAVSVVIAPVSAGGDKVAFPENYAKGVMYATLDRPDLKQFREFYITHAGFEAARNGQPLPSGTVITNAQFKAQLDAQGNPVKDANGRFIKTPELIGYTVMEQRTGWGAEYPESKRNGEWEYQAFRPDGKVNDKADLNTCFECHKPNGDSTNFMFTADKLKAAAK
jgi:hypothetical protein